MISLFDLLQGFKIFYRLFLKMVTWKVETNSHLVIPSFQFDPWKLQFLFWIEIIFFVSICEMSACLSCLVSQHQAVSFPLQTFFISVWLWFIMNDLEQITVKWHCCLNKYRMYAKSLIEHRKNLYSASKIFREKYCP